jgi:hypothetical protein
MAGGHANTFAAYQLRNSRHVWTSQAARTARTVSTGKPNSAAIASGDL